MKPYCKWYCLLQIVNPVMTYAVPAVNGFFKSIALSSGNSLQDTLRYVLPSVGRFHPFSQLERYEGIKGFLGHGV